ncbi:MULTISPECIES: CBS domain-containing protein [Roseovarius]|jgi:CBS domain-containing protein|uniref:CBS domain-containing protein n=2 Tax=Roseovarius nubinhibens TaxID=314263 RepID=A3SR68_ROSNI|nr:CBS domain-containing protein [Roseovarius nubinhibens]EAP75091.1 CBS domain-containing protein [Roseovarius nubinhibens ISM]MBU2998651.1 CBS domain-containing protein [Roseovarius nubinhibens]HAR52867.1 CBS domain-containing protein [Roseovarius nubinhibens]|tara:strand:- start:957 stop:1391 length:435 start_codon:yes stop_codon:yes gene_type:complete
MLVQQILKAKGDDKVITIKPGTLVSDAARILAERRIGGLVVSEDGKQIQGILSERDIVRSLAVRGATCLSDRIDDMMTRNPVCCARGDTSDQVLTRMTEGRFRHMPVVEDGELVGIVTIGDVVSSRLSELAMEKDALQGMIMGH